ncbi:exonuclease domain-containing protein [Pseudostreptobacillus hongkongensis]|uniref:exonuclease domain-containing protein n=1 Tax=Pseudostreptobacillus hongkongensis TaxID=1162717 RepID=UPI00082F219E|nr:exonuclease domain-containing protein [Pseudostreptobacillus hongkongensis]
MLEKEDLILVKKAKKVKAQIDKNEKYLKLLEYCKKNLDILNPIILDVETTGVRRTDEIIQVSIIDLNGKVLFDRYIKPRHVEEWEKAYQIHGIDKEMLENKKNITHYRREIEKILKKHKLIIGYQVQTDMIFLERAQIETRYNVVLDIAYPFTQILLNDGVIENTQTPSLKNLSSMYGYEFDAHNSLEDCVATLYCFNKLLEIEDDKIKYRYDKDIIENISKKINENKKLDKLTKLSRKFVDIYEEYSNKIILDLETTGIREDDEIIQISIIDLEGKTLFNEYIKPQVVEEWDDAYKIHKISKEMLEDKKNIEEYRQKIQKILNNTTYIIGYGIDFDYKLLKRQGFNVDHIKKVDISEYFKYLYRKILKDVKAKRPKLIECASFYGFKGDNYHDSLTDCMATLYSYKAMYKDLLKETGVKNEGKNSKEK